MRLKRLSRASLAAPGHEGGEQPPPTPPTDVHLVTVQVHRLRGWHPQPRKDFDAGILVFEYEECQLLECIRKLASIAICFARQLMIEGRSIRYKTPIADDVRGERHPPLERQPLRSNAQSFRAAVGGTLASGPEFKEDAEPWDGMSCDDAAVVPEDWDWGRVDAAGTWDDGIDASELRDDGIDSSEAWDDGIDASELCDDGIDSSEAWDDGINASELRDDGTDASEAWDDGINASELRDDGTDASEAWDDGINDSELCDDEIDASEPWGGLDASEPWVARVGVSNPCDEGIDFLGTSEALSNATARLDTLSATGTLPLPPYAPAAYTVVEAPLVCNL
ncbi:hypothetical protein BDN71DRAFT_1499821 [Pleurotus eryngii]|uniref:Uncharacterized protein n=1 Tax=Pleurotus eryngii TaxID=5323 RepID=A0A9P5ZI80_PLEER|nr:hypothetical protein BDN71DRAFT_1499821 [Pleurotus eryngii]